MYSLQEITATRLTERVGAGGGEKSKRVNIFTEIFEYDNAESHV